VRSARVCAVVISSEVEKSLTVSSPLVRNYDFWVYIVTNRNHSVLYLGTINYFPVVPGNIAKQSVRIFQLRPCDKLIYYEH
jgi:hypothetical protein